MQKVRESLNSHSLPPIVRYKKAKTYNETSTLVLEMARVRCRFKKDLSILTNARTPPGRFGSSPRGQRSGQDGERNGTHK